MPIYEYECKKCGFFHEKIRSISECNDTALCPQCKSESKRLISSSANRREWEPYVEENLGEQPVLVESREHYKKLLKERGLENVYKHKPGMPGQWV